MAEVVNLRAARKARDRAKARVEADENAARFGRSKALKALEKARADRARASHDAHLREEPGE